MSNAKPTVNTPWEIKVKAVSCLWGLQRDSDLSCHWAELGEAKSQNLLARKRTKEKNDREGQSGGGGNKKRARERQASFRNRGSRVKEACVPGLKASPWIRHFSYFFFSFSVEAIPALSFYWRTCQHRLISPEVSGRNSSAAVSSLSLSSGFMIMAFFSPRYVDVIWSQIFIFRLAYPLP